MAWTKYKEIKYAVDGIPGENLTDFPKLVSIVADADIAAELSSGGGVKFTSADGLTDLAFGLYPSTDLDAGTVLARVKLTLLTAANVGDVLCRLYYSSSESTTEDKAGTVSNDYALFMPLEEDPSGSAPQMFDWVSESNVGTSAGTMTSGDLVAGQVGNGLEFDGSDDEIEIPDSAAWDSDYLTAEAIVTPQADGNFRFIVVRATGTNCWYMAIGGGGTLNHAVWNTGGTAGNPIVSSQFSTGVTASTAVRFDGSNVTGFVNGASVGSGALTGTMRTSGSPVKIGRLSGNPMWGIVDEVRISSVARSANWLAYAYTDDFDNADTFTLSAEQGGGTPAARRGSLLLLGCGN